MVLLAGFAAGMVLQASPLRLTIEGKPNASIVISRQADDTERYAAAELSEYIERISGARLPIVAGEASDAKPRIFVGRTGMSRLEFEALGPTEQADAEGSGTTAHLQAALADKDEDTFIVLRDWDDVFLVGASERATLYAVYDFLEHDLGCRWLGPAPLWEEIPENPNIEIGHVDRLEEPGLRYRLLREIAGLWHEPGSFQAYNGDWALKRKVNVNMEWPGKTRHREVGDVGNAPVRMRAWIRPHTTGSHLVSADKYFESHPEWFAKMPERARYNWRGTGRSRGHLCLSNPEVIEKITAELIEMFNQQPHKEMLMIGSDGGDTWCQCANCMALDPEPDRLWFWRRPDYTPRWLTFLNQVTEGVNEVHPDKKILTLGYRPTMPPPRADEVQPHPNLAVELATWSPLGCRLHPIEDEMCMPHADLRDVYGQWEESTPGGMLLYEYIGRASMRQMPYPVPRRLVADIAYLRDRGLIGYEGQTHGSRWGTYTISKYAVGKAMWNPDLDVDELIKDFCDHAFHEASEPMQHFFTVMEQGISAAECSWDTIWHAFTPEVLDVARRYLNEAHRLAADSAPIVRERLRSIEVDLHCAELVVPAFHQEVQARTDNNPEGLAEAIKAVQGAIDYVREAAAEGPHGVHTVSTLGRWVRSQNNALRRMQTELEEPDRDEAEM